MRYMSIKVPSLMILIFALGVLMTADNGKSETDAAQNSVITEVEHNKVCMVTNKLFQTEQIPIVVSDKTYYGCCEMCKAQLANNPDKRVATDPVSGKIVDKADAVTGATSNGNIYYFENKENLNSFAKR